MKAIFVNKPFDVHIEEVPKPGVRNPDDVLIRIISAGICGSDIGIYNGTNSLATYPRLIGHEYGGIVEAVGDRVSRVSVGETVAVDPVRSCGTCYACSIGRHNVCSSLEVTGVHRDGGFAEYVVAPAKNVHRVDITAIPREYVSMVEPYSIGAQVNSRARTEPGDLVLVMGSGPIGLCVMQVAKSRGAKVVMTDIIDTRLRRASEMGADLTVNVHREKLEDAVYAFSGKTEFTVIVDSVCSPESFEQALQLACPAGRVVTLGLGNKPSHVAQVHITKKELDIVGSRLSNNRFPEVIKGFEQKALTPWLLVTHQFHFSQVAEAFELIRSKPEEVCKVLLRFE